MNRLILILPGLLGDENGSVLASPPSCLKRLAAEGDVLRLTGEFPESSFLGLDPTEAQLQPGPLSVAAFGADPPDRSVQFRLSLVSLEDSALSEVAQPIPNESLELILAKLERLQTPKLRVVRGHDRDHALVWEEGSIELGTTAPTDFPRPFRSSLPEGDGEVQLRRFIDDSVNMLSEMEFNERRIDEGLPPINCAWPWGQGFRKPVPNLGIRYGIPVEIESGTLNLAGLARLAGVRHGDWKTFDRGTATPLKRLDPSRPFLIAVPGAFQRFRPAGEVEEMGWLLSELDRLVLDPWSSLDTPVEITVAALSGEEGIVLRWTNAVRMENRVPFDERALHERIQRLTLHEVVRSALA